MRDKVESMMAGLSDADRASLQASKTEKFIEKYMAPNLLTTPGRITMLVIYAILIGGSIYGVINVEINFEFNYFIGEESDVYDWFEQNDKYFNTGSLTTTYVDNPNVDYSSREVQEKMILFNKNLMECTICEEKWNIPITLEMWYHDFNKWTRDGNCPGVPADTQATAETYIIPQASYYTCLNRFMESDDSKQYDKDIKYDGTITMVNGSKVSNI